MHLEPSTEDCFIRNRQGKRISDKEIAQHHWESGKIMINNNINLKTQSKGTEKCWVNFELKLVVFQQEWRFGARSQVAVHQGANMQ